MNRIYWVSLAFVLCIQPTANAALDVFIDFTADIRGAAGSDWVENLDSIATAAGISVFTAGERATIEAGIKSKLETMYGAYNVVFSTAVPGGAHERINFGAFDATPGSLGVAPLDFMNLAASSIVDPEGSSARVFSNNFAFIIESGDPRATIISELTAAIAGTGGHEMGHSVGAQHHHSYGDPGITPANYADTGGIQNTHIMATGSTGLDEVGRETDRTFSQWENLMLEAAGGANALLHGTTGTSLATTILGEIDSFTGGDVGGTTATAKALGLTSLPISSLLAANTVSSLSSDLDVDVYKFTTTGSTRLLADVWTNNLYSDSFDSFLRLYDTNGTTVLRTNDDTTYSGNAFNDGTVQSMDSSLLNIALATAGTYFLEVSSTGNINGPAGGAYNLIFGLDETGVPEPSSFMLLIAAAVAAGARQLRRRKTIATGTV